MRSDDTEKRKSGLQVVKLSLGSMDIYGAALEVNKRESTLPSEAHLRPGSFRISEANRIDPKVGPASFREHQSDPWSADISATTRQWAILCMPQSSLE